MGAGASAGFDSRAAFSDPGRRRTSLGKGTATALANGTLQLTGAVIQAIVASVSIAQMSLSVSCLSWPCGRVGALYSSTDLES